MGLDVQTCMRSALRDEQPQMTVGRFGVMAIGQNRTAREDWQAGKDWVSQQEAGFRNPCCSQSRLQDALFPSWLDGKHLPYLNRSATILIL